MECRYPDVLRPSGNLGLGTTQSNLVDNLNTKVLLDTIAAGFTDGIEDTVNHRITPAYAGFYIVLGMVVFINTVPDKHYSAGIFVSETFWPSYNVGSAGGTTMISVPVLALVFLTAADYVELWAKSNSGDNTVDLHGDGSYTYLMAQRVR